jgi:HlyD family secretion protein
MIANDLKNMQINASVAEADIGSVDTNQNVKFTVDAFPGRDFVGKVVQVRNAAQTVQNVVSYDTIIDVDNRDEKLKPGMTANVQIITAERKDVLVIPNSALRFKPPEGIEVKQPADAAPAEGTTKAAPGAIPDTPEAVLAKMREYREKGETAPDELRAKIREFIQAGKIDPAQAFAGGGGRGPGGGPGGPGGPGGGGRGSRSGGGGAPKKAPDRPTSATIYVVVNSGSTTNASASAAPMVLESRKIKTGITDGVNTEVIEGLAAGDVVATGQVLARASAAGAQRPTNPFSSGSRRGP